MKRFIAVSDINHLDKIVSANNYTFGLMCQVGGISKNFANRFRRMNIEKICDSGIFAVERYTYKELFDRYDFVNATWGVMLDKYRDMSGTLDSAKEAINVHKSGTYTFKLVGVCQGNTPYEYRCCAKQLFSLGYNYLAVGCILVNAGGRYHIESTIKLQEIIKQIRKEYNGWLFALGCNANRLLPMLQYYNIYGADSKSWVFCYRKGHRTTDLISYLTNYEGNYMDNYDDYWDMIG